MLGNRWIAACFIFLATTNATTFQHRNPLSPTTIKSSMPPKSNEGEEAVPNEPPVKVEVPVPRAAVKSVGQVLGTLINVLGKAKAKVDHVLEESNDDEEEEGQEAEAVDHKDTYPTPPQAASADEKQKERGQDATDENSIEVDVDLGDVGRSIKEGFETVDWKEVGKTVKGGLEEVDWKDVGKSIKDGVEEVDWKGVGESIKGGLQEVDWKSIGDSISDAFQSTNEKSESTNEKSETSSCNEPK